MVVMVGTPTAGSCFAGPVEPRARRSIAGRLSSSSPSLSVSAVIVWASGRSAALTGGVFLRAAVAWVLSLTLFPEDMVSGNTRVDDENEEAVRRQKECM